jgi:putative MATE family efflux protein
MAVSNTEEKIIRMTSAPVPGLIVRLALPAVAIQLTTNIYNMADTFFVGSLGTSAVGAVGIGFPFMSIIQATGFFFGQGSGNFMSRALGAKELDKAARMAATGLVSGFIIMLVIALCCLLNLKGLVFFLGSTPTIAPYAVKYLRYILFASPWMVAATVLNQQLRFQGSAAIAMKGTMTGAILNIFLDPLFIYPLGFGISGAGIATMISQITSFTILLFYGTTREGNIRIRLRNFSPSFRHYAEVCRGGVPSLLRQGLMSVTTIILNHFAGVYGDAAIAAISIVQRVGQFANQTMLGLGQGFQPVCGFNYGAKRYDRVKQGFWFILKVGTVGLFITAILLSIFAPFVIALFRKDDPAVISIGTLGLRLRCCAMPFTCWVVATNNLTQTMGKAFIASLNSISRRGIFLVPTLLIMTRVFGMGLTGILACIPVSDFLGFCLAVPISLAVLRRLGRRKY